MNRLLHNLIQSLKAPRPKPARQASLRVESLEDRWVPSGAKFSAIVYVPKEVIISSARALADDCDCSCSPTVSWEEVGEQAMKQVLAGVTQ